jgi:hypothetical protein
VKVLDQIGSLAGIECLHRQHLKPHSLPKFQQATFLFIDLPSSFRDAIDCKLKAKEADFKTINFSTSHHQKNKGLDWCFHRLFSKPLTAGLRDRDQIHKLFFMKKSLILLFLTSMLVFSSCNDLGKKIDDQIKSISEKADKLDSLVNKEIEKMESLDSLINIETDKIIRMDSLLEKSTQKVDSLVNNKIDRINKIVN